MKSQEISGHFHRNGQRASLISPANTSPHLLIKAETLRASLFYLIASFRYFSEN